MLPPVVFPPKKLPLFYKSKAYAGYVPGSGSGRRSGSGARSGSGSGSREAGRRQLGQRWPRGVPGGNPAKSFRACLAILRFGQLKLAFCVELYEKARGANIFALLAAPRSFKKSVILHGAVCKNSDETIVVERFRFAFSEQSM